MPINGEYYDWEDITIFAPTGPQLDAFSVSWKSSKELEEVYGQGGAPRGFGQGNWKGEGELGLLREQFDLLVAYAAAAGVKGVYGIKPFPITVAYTNDDSGLRNDQLIGCKITEIDTSPKQGDKRIEVMLKFAITKDIENNGVSQTSGMTKF